MRSVALLLGLLLPALSPAESPARPNFLILFVDDLGARHVGYQGGAYDTPRINALAAQSLLFSRAYIPTPTCSPSRAALLTGRHPARLGIFRHIPTSPKFGFDAEGRTDQEFHPWPNDPSGSPSRNWLPLEETTFAEALGDLGYRTAFFGKWHLGHEPYHPVRQGFDRQFGVSNFGHPSSYYPPYWKTGNPYPKTLPDKYLTDRLADDVVAYLKETPDDGPFLATVFFYNVHAPHIGRRDLVAKYQARGMGDDRANLAAMVEATDQAIGRMLDALETSGKADETVVVFLGDQGGLRYNEPLRGGKPGGTALYEGGARVPMTIRGPQVRARTETTPVLSTDVFPTLVDLAGGTLANLQPLDGITLKPLLAGPAKLPREALFLERRYEDQYAAVIQGDRKLVAYWSGKRELYDLAADPGETHDLSEAKPDEVRRLSRLLAQWRAERNLKPEPASN